MIPFPNFALWQAALWQAALWQAALWQAALWQSTKTPNLWPVAFASAVGLFAAGLVVLFFVRRFFQNTRDARQKTPEAVTRAENPSAFMAASMQGVIQKLREQEKELERLHRAEKERAAHTERLSEEVTRNMPAGVGGGNATGVIFSVDPAGGKELGLCRVGVPRGSEAVGGESWLSRVEA